MARRMKESWQCKQNTVLLKRSSTAGLVMAMKMKQSHGNVQCKLNLKSVSHVWHLVMARQMKESWQCQAEYCLLKSSPTAGVAMAMKS